MQPTIHTAVGPPQKPLGARLAEMLSDRRLPGKVQGMLDSLAMRLGFPEKTILRNGFRFRIRRRRSDEPIVENVTVRGEYNPPGFELRPTDTVVDIGGNIGAFAVRAASMAARVVTIEPESANFRLLETNLRLNKAANATPVHAAIAGSPGTITLHVANYGGYHSILTGHHEGTATEVVQCLTLADIFVANQIDRCHFLKCDCEGAEHEIFATALEDILRRIDRIAMEWHGPQEREQRIQQASVLVDRLVAASFRIDSFTEFQGFRSGMLFAHR